jgi:hypothetical protein
MHARRARNSHATAPNSIAIHPVAEMKPSFVLASLVLAAVVAGYASAQGTCGEKTDGITGGTVTNAECAAVAVSGNVGTAKAASAAATCVAAPCDMAEGTGADKAACCTDTPNLPIVTGCQKGSGSQYHHNDAAIAACMLDATCAGILKSAMPSCTSNTPSECAVDEMSCINNGLFEDGRVYPADADGLKSTDPAARVDKGHDTIFCGCKSGSILLDLVEDTCTDAPRAISNFDMVPKCRANALCKPVVDCVCNPQDDADGFPNLLDTSDTTCTGIDNTDLLDELTSSIATMIFMIVVLSVCGCIACCLCCHRDRVRNVYNNAKTGRHDDDASKTRESEPVPDQQKEDKGAGCAATVAWVQKKSKGAWVQCTSCCTKKGVDGAAVSGAGDGKAANQGTHANQDPHLAVAIAEPTALYQPTAEPGFRGAPPELPDERRSTTPLRRGASSANNNLASASPRKPLPALPPARPLPAALPAGWSESYDPSGQAYYVHAATNATQWEKPAAP